MEENKNKKGRYQRKEIAKTPLKGNKKALPKHIEADFMKIKEGETMQEWESRTQKLRVLPEKEHEKQEYIYKTRSDSKPIKAVFSFRSWQERALTNELSKSEQIAYKKTIAKQKRQGLVRYQGKKDPLLHFKYYFVVSRLLEARYNLKPQDISFIFHLYGIDRPFLKREFDEKAMIVSSASFKKYLNLSIIQRLKYAPTQKNFKKSGYSPFYSLTTKACVLVKTGMSMLMGGDFNPEGNWYNIARKNSKNIDNFKKTIDLYYVLRQEIKDLEQGTISDDKFYPIQLNISELVNLEGDGNLNL
jgi:hypothetical protein